MAKEIILGQGNYIVGGIHCDGKEGIVISACKNHNRKIDTPVPKEIAEACPVECIIWFEDLTAARLFQDQANSACLFLNGYTVNNS